MAKIGLENFRYGVLTEAENGTATYSAPKKPAKAVSCKVDVTSNDASLYADDTLAESDKSFASAKITIGIDEDDPETMATLLGHKIDESTKEIVRNSNDKPPYVGFGRIITKMVNGATKYKVEFLCKVKFGEPSADEKTKGSNVDFTTTELEGNASTLANGDWSKSQQFDTRAEALTYLLKCFGASSDSSDSSSH